MFELYNTNIEGNACYLAGLPDYPRNFSRDTIIAGLIACSEPLLSSQVAMSRHHQGKNFNPLTGEEPGKIHHEYPGVIVHEPYVSTYNACDTTALYLIGLDFLQHLIPDRSALLALYQPSVERALIYLQNHIKDDLFWEFPPNDEEHFSLHITYWKDSILPSRHGNVEPHYPVAYALAQFQVARGLLAAAQFLNDTTLALQADRLFRKGIETFIRPESFCILIDGDGRLEQTSSDELHALAYLPAEYAMLLPLATIAERASALITPAGIACTPETVSRHLSDTYHGHVVWIFEQAFIHYGCQKFGLEELATLATQCEDYIKAGQELMSVQPTISPLGNDRQLWSVATKQYFSDVPSLRQRQWL